MGFLELMVGTVVLWVALVGVLVSVGLITGKLVATTVEIMRWHWQERKEP